jgi:hypothetical protein
MPKTDSERPLAHKRHKPKHLRRTEARVTRRSLCSQSKKFLCSPVRSYELVGSSPSIAIISRVSAASQAKTSLNGSRWGVSGLSGMPWRRVVGGEMRADLACQLRNSFPSFPSDPNGAGGEIERSERLGLMNWRVSEFGLMWVLSGLVTAGIASSFGKIAGWGR